MVILCTIFIIITTYTKLLIINSQNELLAYNAMELIPYSLCDGYIPLWFLVAEAEGMRTEKSLTNELVLFSSIFLLHAWWFYVPYAPLKRESLVVSRSEISTSPSFASPLFGSASHDSYVFIRMFCLFAVYFVILIQLLSAALVALCARIQLFFAIGGQFSSVLQL